MWDMYNTRNTVPKWNMEMLFKCYMVILLFFSSRPGSVTKQTDKRKKKHKIWRCMSDLIKTGKYSRNTAVCFLAKCHTSVYDELNKLFALKTFRKYCQKTMLCRAKLVHICYSIYSTYSLPQKTTFTQSEVKLFIYWPFRHSYQLT